MAVDRVTEGQMAIRKPASTSKHSTVHANGIWRAETRSLREILAPAEAAMRAERLQEKQRRQETSRPNYDFWSFRVRF